MYKCQTNWTRSLRLVSNDRKSFKDYTFATKSEKSWISFEVIIRFRQSFFQEKLGKNNFFPKLDSFSTLHCPQTIQYSNLNFDMTKWSVVSNIHWKFEGFWSSSFRATKVYYLPFRSKDGVDKLIHTRSVYLWPR